MMRRYAACTTSSRGIPDGDGMQAFDENLFPKHSRNGSHAHLRGRCTAPVNARYRCRKAARGLGNAHDWSLAEMLTPSGMISPVGPSDRRRGLAAVALPCARVVAELHGDAGRL